MQVMTITALLDHVPFSSVLLAFGVLASLFACS